MTATKCFPWCVEHMTDGLEVLHNGAEQTVKGEFVDLRIYPFHDAAGGTVIALSGETEALTLDEARRLVTALQHALNLTEEVAP